MRMISSSKLDCIERNKIINLESHIPVKNLTTAGTFAIDTAATK